MEYFLIHKDQPTEYLLIGTKSFDSFWPDQGLRALMNIVEKVPEKIPQIEVKTSSGKVLSISEFLENIRNLRVRSNG
tara:strand:- start:437 stop:667 length:231 start_codon:yes stop_codon:yes gene_type:complete